MTIDLDIPEGRAPTKAGRLCLLMGLTILLVMVLGAR